MGGVRGQKKVMNPREEWLRDRTGYWKGWWEVRIAEGKAGRKNKFCINALGVKWGDVDLRFQEMEDSGKDVKDDNNNKRE